MQWKHSKNSLILMITWFVFTTDYRVVRCVWLQLILKIINVFYSCHLSLRVLKCYNCLELFCEYLLIIYHYFSYQYHLSLTNFLFWNFLKKITDCPTLRKFKVTPLSDDIKFTFIAFIYILYKNNLDFFLFYFIS